MFRLNITNSIRFYQRLASAIRVLFRSNSATQRSHRLSAAESPLHPSSTNVRTINFAIDSAEGKFGEGVIFCGEQARNLDRRQRASLQLESFILIRGSPTD